MIENGVSGLYYFFLGEEVGCVGSKKLAAELKENKIEGITKVISFDRRHTTSIITHQFGTRCCSDEFGSALAKALNEVESSFGYKNDPTGLYTDSAQFVRIYPECTNISVGYWAEHTFGESQNINHLEKLAQACVKIDWESLPIKRDPLLLDTHISSYGWGDDLCDGLYDDYPTTQSSYAKDKKNYTWSNSTPKQPEPKDETYWFKDAKYSYWSFINLQKSTGKITKIDLCRERLEEELSGIKDFLLQLEVEFKYLHWDGIELSVTLIDGSKEVCDRKEIVEFLPALDFWKPLIEDDDGW
jgi:hypothetical protein